MELGHIFQLGTRYSEMMNGKFTDKDGKEQLYYMGCYGIGVSRTVATIYENSAIQDENGKVVGISLPKEIAPYQVQIIPKIENEETQLINLQKRYRKGEIKEEDLTEEQVKKLCDLYDKQIENLQKSNSIRKENILKFI